MSRVSKLSLAAVLLALSAIAVVFVYQRALGPPAAARWLPEGEFLLYANLKPGRLLLPANAGGVHLEADFQDFIQQTGIQPERDLDEVAMSRHEPGHGADTESAEIFIGHFEVERLRRYLQNASNSNESYAGKTIFSIPHQGHTVRVCILGKKTVAATNMPSPEPMHAMIDRYRHRTSLPYLVENYYRYVPKGSLGWLIYKMPESGPLPGGLTLYLLRGKVAVASARYLSALSLRVEVFAESEEAARQLTDSAGSFLAVYRSIASATAPKGNDPDVKAAVDSIQIAQEGSRSVVTLTIPAGFVRKALQSPLARPTP